jgi:hypothetical protein
MFRMLIVKCLKIFGKKQLCLMCRQLEMECTLKSITVSNASTFQKSLPNSLIFRRVHKIAKRDH